MKGRFGFISIVLFLCSAVGVWYFGYKYYWWIYYPSLGKTFGGPEVTTTEAHLWTYGMWISIIVAVLSLIGIGKFSVDKRQRGQWSCR